MDSLASRFMALFRGLERAHGVYKLGATNGKGKQQGQAMTVQSPVTEEKWQQHLDGDVGIGIVPLNDDGVSWFGAIDIDDYQLDLNAVAKRVIALQLPLWPVRSKSGGLHLYVFFSEPIVTRHLREIMAGWVVALGFPGVEIFPKQSDLANQNDVGNWINMPYFDAHRSTRYAMIEGNPVSAERFVDVALSSRITPDEAKPAEVAEDETLPGAPPCLMMLARCGVAEGQRNIALFNFGVYSRLSTDSWEDNLANLNHGVFDPPLGLKELQTVVKSLNKKEYFYTCTDKVLAQYCNKDACRKREFGIGSGDAPAMPIDAITKLCTSPPTYFAQICGRRVQLESSTSLLNQRNFQRAVFESLDFIPPTIKPAEWNRYINEIMKDAEVIEAPEDAGVNGQFRFLLEQFCTTRAMARSRDELLLGKPWSEGGQTFFRSGDLIKYLEQQRFKDTQAHRIWSLLRNFGAGHKQFNLKGACVQAWYVDDFSGQTEEHEVPRVPKEKF